MTEKTDIDLARQTEPYLKEFSQLEKEGLEPAWLAPLRKSGISSFARQGFPTLRDEDWRYTNVAPIARSPFRPVFKDRADIDPGVLQRTPFKSIPGCRLVFVDGHFSPELSAATRLPEGVTVVNVAESLSRDSGFMQKNLGKHAVADGNAFAALNQAFFFDGGFIHVRRGIQVPEPVQLVFVSSGAEAGTAAHPRNLIVTEPESSLTVIETYVSAGEAAGLTNAVTEVVAGENSDVELVKFQDQSRASYHVAAIHGHFGKGSNVRVHSFALGARLSRNNIRVKLAGEGLECILNGLYLTQDEQLADHHMVVEHAQPNCASHEYFNGILDDKSRGVFHGRIFVHQVAQKTDAKQTNKNLLLSDEAMIDTKPQLEIYADDVKCTHGATIGQLNDEAIFYLRSRGLGTEIARQMLIHAFAGEIIERVKFRAVRDELDQIIWSRLESNPHLAAGR